MIYDIVLSFPASEDARVCHGYAWYYIPKDSYYQKRKKYKLFCKRAGIEPTIGHLKADHRLSRNFYKGMKGDAINVLLSAAAYNFKRAMRVLLYFIKRISIELVNTSFMLKYSF